MSRSGTTEELRLFSRHPIPVCLLFTLFVLIPATLTLSPPQGRLCLLFSLSSLKKTVFTRFSSRDPLASKKQTPICICDLVLLDKNPLDRSIPDEDITGLSQVIWPKPTLQNFRVTTGRAMSSPAIRVTCGGFKVSIWRSRKTSIRKWASSKKKDSQTPVPDLLHSQSGERSGQTVESPLQLPALLRF